MKFKGSFPALITPFKNGSIDEDAFQSFVNWQIEQGSHGLVPVGTTGESPTLSHDEHKRAVELCIEAADGRVPVIAGAVIIPVTVAGETVAGEGAAQIIVTTGGMQLPAAQAHWAGWHCCACSAR